MKKIHAILMALLLLVSMGTFSVSAEGEAVNYALTSQYIYGSSSFLSSEESGISYADDACTILTDGVAPYYAIEESGLGVVLTGSGASHIITFDLGATYDDIYEINFLNVWDSYNFGYEGQPGNRGFEADNVKIKLSADGVNYERSKDFEIVKENHTEDGSENGFYDFKFKFNAPVTAKAIELLINAPAACYCLSLSEIEVWGNGHSIPTPEVSEESSEEVLEESSEEAEESAVESVEESKEEASKAEESKAEESKAEASKTENSKADTSKTDTSKGDDEGGSSPVIFIVIGAVVVVAVVVVVVLKKKK